MSKKIIYFALGGWLVLDVLSLLLYPTIFGGRCYFQTNWFLCGQNSDLVKSIILIFVVLSSLALLYSGYRFWKNYLNNIEIKKSILLIFSFLFLALLVVPFGSSDSTYYYSSGKAMARGVNPFIQNWQIERTFFSPQLEPTIGFSYGPVTAYIFRFLYTISFGIPYVFIIAWKLFISLAILACGFLIFKLSVFFNPSASWNKIGLFWCLQPLLLFEALGNGHFDILWLLFVLLAIWAAILQKWWAVFPLLVIGVWIKFIPIFVIPIFTLWWWQEIRSKKVISHILQLALGIALSSIITVAVWQPFWTGFEVFKPLASMSKWAVDSLFALVYYSLEPLATKIIPINFHWYLTRFVHAIIFAAFILLLYPLIKKAFCIFIWKEWMSPSGYIFFIFTSLFAYLSIWQKAFWPWYVLWVIPLGIIAYEKSRNADLGKIIMWLSLAPLTYYPIYGLNSLLRKTDAPAELWFWWVYVPLVWAYPLYYFIKLRKDGFKSELI